MVYHTAWPLSKFYYRPGVDQRQLWIVATHCIYMPTTVKIMVHVVHLALHHCPSDCQYSDTMEFMWFATACCVSTWSTKSISIAGSSVQLVSSVHDLGVFIDSDLGAMLTKCGWFPPLLQASYASYDDLSVMHAFKWLVMSVWFIPN